MAETELIRRLERLERDNRRLKGFAFAAVVLAAAVGASYAARPIPQTVVAHAFEAVDSSGKVGVKIEAQSNRFVWPSVGLYDAQGRERASLELDPLNATEIALCDAQGNPRAVMAVGLSGHPAIYLRNARDDAQVDMDVEGGPRVELSDPQGFIMDLGSTGTEKVTTGETQQTSAASIVMFGNGKQHKVIWQAP